MNQYEKLYYGVRDILQKATDEMTLLGQGLNFGGFGDGGAASFVPSGTPYVRYDASQIVGLSADDPVATWADLQGSKDLTQGTASKRPLYKTAVQNGLPGVYSDASALQSINVSFGAALSQPNTWFLVFKADGFQGGIDIIADSYGSGQRQAIYYSGANQYFHMYAGSQIISTTARDNNAHVITGLFNGASSSLRLDGVEILTGNTGSNTLDGVALFNAAGGSDPGRGYMLEVIVYNGAESPADNETGLMAKWGI